MASITYTDNEISNKPFTKENAIATARALLQDRDPKGKKPWGICSTGIVFKQTNYNYPDFNDLVEELMFNSLYYSCP